MPHDNPWRPAVECAKLKPMNFGNGIRPAGKSTPTEWIGQSCHGELGRVGALVPNQYESLLRVYAPPSGSGDWWLAYRDLYKTVAAVGQRYTSSPYEAFFAVWEGHGFDNATSQVAWQEPAADDAEQQARDAKWARLRAYDRERNAAIRLVLGQILTLDRPDHTYYLLEGPVMAVTDLRYPGTEGWRNPDLFWPADRAWFVATDVEFWSLYIGGSSAFVAELVQTILVRSESVAFDLRLEIED